MGLRLSPRYPQLTILTALYALYHHLPHMVLCAVAVLLLIEE